MFYGYKQSVSSYPISFINDGTEEEINTFCFMPSNSYVLDNSSFNLNFNAEVNSYTSIVMPDTIYKRFSDDYITDMFSVKRRIYNIDAIFPDYFLNQLKLNDRFIDLIIPFRGGGYYHHDFGGGFSIKKVLPALCPEDQKLDYKNLEISNGGMASAAYKEMRNQTKEEVSLKRKKLFDYCWLDTYAMYAIYTKLQDCIK